MTGAEHFAKAAEILAEVEDDLVTPPPGTAWRTDALQRAAIHAQLAQAAAIVHYTPHPSSGSYIGYGYDG